MTKNFENLPCQLFLAIISIRLPTKYSQFINMGKRSLNEFLMHQHLETNRRQMLLMIFIHSGFLMTAQMNNLRTHPKTKLQQHVGEEQKVKN